MTIFFTSDHHFGHKNIIHLARRPFHDVEEMDRVMIERWNEVVNPEDVVYYLGDISYYKADKTAEILDQLNGYKYLVYGNHDSRRIKELPHWIEVYHYLELPYNGIQPIVLFHYPIEDWNRMFRGAMHFHGHSHNNCPSQKNRFDMSVECWDYTPVSIGDLIARRVDKKEIGYRAD